MNARFRALHNRPSVILGTNEDLPHFKSEALLSLTHNKVGMLAILFQNPRLAAELCSLLDKKSFTLFLVGPCHC